MFEQAFGKIDDILRKEDGCGTERDYVEQTSWLSFLKYPDALEQDGATEAALGGKKHGFILDNSYRWAEWVAPRGKGGPIDLNNARTGDDFRNFVNQRQLKALSLLH